LAVVQDASTLEGAAGVLLSKNMSRGTNIPLATTAKVMVLADYSDKPTELTMAQV
jgi:hypothetical protein